MAAAREEAAAHGMAFCHPFDDPAVVAGQGTLGLELMEDVHELACVVVPLGGGGLASGLAIAVKSLRPDVRVIGVQAERCAPYAGEEPSTGPIVTLADGIAVKRPGQLTGPLVERWIDDVVTVHEDAIADAMVFLMDRAKLYVEGAGAVGVAAVQSGLVDLPDTGTTCIVLSGGNLDLGVVPGLIRRHETEAGRRLVVAATDRRPSGRPGQVAPGVRLGRCQPHRGPSRATRACTCTSGRPPCTRRSRCAAPSTPSRSSTPCAPQATSDLRVDTG